MSFTILWMIVHLLFYICLRTLMRQAIDLYFNLNPWMPGQYNVAVSVAKKRTIKLRDFKLVRGGGRVGVCKEGGGGKDGDLLVWKGRLTHGLLLLYKPRVFTPPPPPPNHHHHNPASFSGALYSLPTSQLILTGQEAVKLWVGGGRQSSVVFVLCSWMIPGSDWWAEKRH